MAACCTGKEITDQDSLAEALKEARKISVYDFHETTRTNYAIFTKAQWEELQVHNLAIKCYIKVGETYFQKVETGNICLRGLGLFLMYATLVGGIIWGYTVLLAFKGASDMETFAIILLSLLGVLLVSMLLCTHGNMRQIITNPSTLVVEACIRPR